MAILRVEGSVVLLDDGDYDKLIEDDVKLKIYRPHTLTRTEERPHVLLMRGNRRMRLRDYIMRPQPGHIITFKDGDTLDHRRDNLVIEEDHRPLPFGIMYEDVEEEDGTIITSVRASFCGDGRKYVLPEHFETIEQAVKARKKAIFNWKTRPERKVYKKKNY